MATRIEEKYLTSDGLLYLVQRLKTVLVKKVDVKEGYSLISDAEITRLASVTNYDDSAVKSDIASLLGKVDALEKGTYDDSELRNLINSCQSDITSLKNKVANWDAAYTHSQSEHAPSDAQANIIESVKVNGSAVTVTNKAVNITVPTNNNQLTNGAGYQTASQVITAISNALANVTGISYQKLNTGEYDSSGVPTVAGKTGVIYLVPKSETETSNIYVEWIYDGEKFEKIGDTTVDLSGYVTTDDALTNEEIEQIWTSVMA